MAGKRQEAFDHLVTQLFREREKNPHLTVTLLRHHWRAILGAEMADRTYPTRLTRNTLWINAVDASWAYQLQFMKGELLQSIQVFTESTAIKDLRFRQGDVPEPGPDTEQETAEQGKAEPAPEATRKTGQSPAAGFAALSAVVSGAGTGGGPEGEQEKTESGPETVPESRQETAPNAEATTGAEAEQQQEKTESGPEIIHDPSLRASFSRWRKGNRGKQRGR